MYVPEFRELLDLDFNLAPERLDLDDQTVMPFIHILLVLLLETVHVAEVLVLQNFQFSPEFVEPDSLLLQQRLILLDQLILTSDSVLKDHSLLLMLVSVGGHVDDK